MKDFNQKIGFEFGKNLKDFSKISYKKIDSAPKNKKEITVSDAIETLMETGKFKEVYGAIGGGKEATVLLAILKENEKYVCAKVYRFYTGTIQKRLLGTKHVLPEEMAAFAAKQEFKNLEILFEAGIAVPEPLYLFDNIVVMDLIAHPDDRTIPAPLVDEIKFANNIDLDEKIKFIEQVSMECIDILVKMFVDCNMIHGDYSIHNLLFSNQGVFTMDLSQSVQYNIKTNTQTPVRVEISRAFDVFKQDLENLASGLKQLFKHEIDTKKIVDEVISSLSPKLQEFLLDNKQMSYDRDFVPEFLNKHKAVQNFYKGQKKDQQRFQGKNKR